MAWDNTWLLSLKNKPWHCCLGESQGKLPEGIQSRPEEGSLCWRPNVCSNVTSATRKTEWYKLVPEWFNPCIMFLDSGFEELTKQEYFSSFVQSFLALERNSKTWTRMPRVNMYVLKMKEGRRAQVWVVALLSVVLWLWRRSKPTKREEKRIQELTMMENEISRKKLGSC